ncbi:MAG TPA: hypothetical protein VNJ08_15875 [Bacteriovoracaceae bacterium]|nr:hypothetical protein [Bacteriovoracaceae bacterium]
MKLSFGIFIILLSFFTFAHEGGHGEVAEGGKYGGVTSPIVDNAQAGMGSKAKTLYVAELVRAESGKLSLYIFDDKMKLVNLEVFGPTIEAKLEVKKKGKFTYFGAFKLTKNGTHFSGQLPKVEYKPFNIDLYIMKNTNKLFVGFSNLD